MKIGLIGAGRWGKCYINTLNHIPGIKLAYLASGNPKSISLIPSDCKITQDWRYLLEDTSLDGVIIATPPETHMEIALGAISAGLPVLIEKPMVLSLSDARNLNKKASDCEVLTMVGHTHLFSAAFRELKIKSQSLGKLKSIRSIGGNWGPFRPDTPMLWDWAPHDIAMSIDLSGSYPIQIEAKQTGWMQQASGIGESFTILLGYESGACTEIHISNIQKDKQRIFEASYEGGSLIYDDLADKKLVFLCSSKLIPGPVSIDKSMPLTNLVAEFCRAIGEGRKSHQSLQLGLQVVEVLVECQMSLNDRLK
ncbi:MAG: Gfo/Idh/MocA family oxidoreductase [Proteobacteria bacterium]|nr:Gfo/Idh/MocA family oxidoreductase [Pseudomonadota bacterium]MBU1585759.1 Gfo/Idh/MocA family oxidoreductase [Pseudomonadota bacterium]MBU2452671.1 Gfo/Idh/MocA family oxidoreductase [Pseudomonadota bacterium]MBU2631390.1 Gfo/Idh/MocA family oxidoreductase [Pseudomonadota bacterium]